jgi:hypothetical protein
MKKILLLLSILISSTLFSQTQVCPDIVCINTQNEDYFVINTPGSTYNWNLSGGGLITSGVVFASTSDGVVEVVKTVSENVPAVPSVQDMFVGQPTF